MFTARTKIQKEGKAEPTPLEEQIAQLIFELQTNSTADFKQELQDLFFTAAKEVDAGAGKKAVVVFVPFRLAKEFHRIQAKLVRELEKKLSGKQVVVIAQRRILPKTSRAARQQRPRSRTLTAVHDAILEDLVYPTEIVGKRTRIRLDGSKVIKMFVSFFLQFRSRLLHS
jgi:small subunit ribosomal protein S7e